MNITLHRVAVSIAEALAGAVLISANLHVLTLARCRLKRWHATA